MDQNRTIADDILEACGMIVCAICKLWMNEHEAEPHTTDNGITRRNDFIHKGGMCPAQQQIYRSNNPQFFGDD